VYLNFCSINSGQKYFLIGRNFCIITPDALSNYQNTLVIDLSGVNSEALSQFTNIVGGKTQTTVPSGEVKPDADILIILGSDFASQ
jgi:hypothetical protein